MHNYRPCFCSVFASLAIGTLLPPLALAVSPTVAEMADARSWAAAKFEGVQASKAPDVGLFVVANNGPVQLNGRGNEPLQIGDKSYARGLYCHAVSKVIVRLPGAGKTFTATAGVDTNDQTSGGRGSVVFSVAVGEKSPFKSGLMREGTPGVAIQVDLEGAKEFVLEVGDGGNGIACDQADWAEAKVALADGQTVWLGDLPIYGPDYQPYSAEPLFSFSYDGKSSAELLRTWKREQSTRKLDESRTEQTLTYTDPKSGLVVRCVGVEYSDFPAVEWTLFFKNTGVADTPILENVQALDSIWHGSEGDEFLLRGCKGDFNTPDSYEPYQQALKPGANLAFAPVGGRGTDRAFPYYSVSMPGGGFIMAVGWPGQWATKFTRDARDGLQVQAGQQLTHLRLKPGEEIRSPLMVLMFWKGADPVRAQNIWRRWMLAHNLPRPDGRQIRPLYSFCSGGFFDGLKVSEASEKQFIDRLTKEGIRLDYWWMDAGWYACNGWGEVGTWEVDPQRFPRGIKAVSDYVHANGAKLIVWFEPERVTAGSWLAQNHPEWLLGGSLLNLGNPAARQWLTDHIDKFITQQGIDLYRQDFNMEPLALWRNNDAPDRQGMTENLHIQGYLAYWDELRRRHPGMLIDSCASGGRRNDLETLRRAAPLLRSDYQSFAGELRGFAPGNQGHTYGLSSWIPFYGQGVYYNPRHFAYSVRSSFSPAFGMCADVRKDDVDWNEYRRMLDQWRQVAECFLGDFYPLMPHTLDETLWVAWQFNRPKQGDGMIQAFRHAESPYSSVQVKCKGLEPDAVYSLTDLDVPGSTEVTGNALMNDGLLIAIKSQPGSAVFRYRKKDR